MSLAFDELAALPLAPCPRCGAETLVFQRPTAGGAEACCVDCDSPVDVATIRWSEPGLVHRAGYSLGLPEQPHGERGCRSGACGIQQPPSAETPISAGSTSTENG